MSALVSFFVGTITLIIIVGLKDRSYTSIKEPFKQAALGGYGLAGS